HRALGVWRNGGRPRGGIGAGGTRRSRVEHGSLKPRKRKASHPRRGEGRSRGRRDVVTRRRIRGGRPAPTPNAHPTLTGRPVHPTLVSSADQHRLLRASPGTASPI